MSRLFPRWLIASLLALMLGLTSVTLASARLEAAGRTEMSLCSGGQAVTVWLDAQGRPTGPPHHCPDCVPQLAALLPALPGVLVMARMRRASPVLPRQPGRIGRVALREWARGPPRRG